MATLSDKLTLAAWNAATEGRGNVKLVWGQYTGKGTYGDNGANPLFFEGKPLWVYIWPDPFDHDSSLTAWHGQQTLQSYVNGVAKNVNAGWSPKSMRWYSTESAAAQMNEYSKTYWYIALVTA